MRTSTQKTATQVESDETEKKQCAAELNIDYCIFKAKLSPYNTCDCWVVTMSLCTHSVPARLPQPCTVRHLVESYLDIAAVPRRSFFELLSTFSTNELEQEKLVEFSSAAGQDELHSYCNRPRRTALEVWQFNLFFIPLFWKDTFKYINVSFICLLSVLLLLQVLADFPHTTAELKADYLLDLFPEIQPRSFSIASSLLVAQPITNNYLTAIENWETREVWVKCSRCISERSSLLTGSPTQASDPGRCGLLQNQDV